jgi:DNA repair protein RecO (recombination protein O)
MALVTTEAVVLHTFRYGETSKIGRLLTLEYGLQSVMAKGALKSRSRFGASLQPLSSGYARLYYRPQRELHTLAEFEVTVQRRDLALSVRRYAAASAIVELVLRCAPAERSPELFRLLTEQLDALAVAEEGDLDGVALASLWSAVRVLGFAPSLDVCARDGNRLPQGPAAFSVADGGLLCPTCSTTSRARKLPARDRAALSEFLEGQAHSPLDRRHAVAHGRLLTRFVEHHLGHDRELKALTFWLDAR